MHDRTYACLDVNKTHGHAYTYVCMLACMYACLFSMYGLEACVHVRVGVCMHVDVHSPHAYMRSCMCNMVPWYACICMHISISLSMSVAISILLHSCIHLPNVGACYRLREWFLCSFSPRKSKRNSMHMRYRFSENG
jgi:hypothetical protein